MVTGVRQTRPTEYSPDAVLFIILRERPYDDPGGLLHQKGRSVIPFEILFTQIHGFHF